MPHRLVPYAMRRCGLIVLEAAVAERLKGPTFRGRRVRCEDFVALCEEAWVEAAGSGDHHHTTLADSKGGGVAARNGGSYMYAHARDGSVAPGGFGEVGCIGGCIGGGNGVSFMVPPSTLSATSQAAAVRPSAAASASRGFTVSAATNSAGGFSETVAGTTAEEECRDEAFLAHVLGSSTHAALLSVSSKPTPAGVIVVAAEGGEESLSSPPSASFGRQHFAYIGRATRGLVDGLFAAFDPESDFGAVSTLPPSSSGMASTTANANKKMGASAALPSAGHGLGGHLFASASASTASSTRRYVYPNTRGSSNTTEGGAHHDALASLSSDATSSNPPPPPPRRHIPVASVASLLCRYPTSGAEGLMGQWVASKGFSEAQYAELLTSLDKQRERHCSAQRRRAAIAEAKGAAGRLVIMPPPIAGSSETSSAMALTLSTFDGGESQQPPLRHRLPQHDIAAALAAADPRRTGRVEYRSFAYLIGALLLTGEMSAAEYSALIAIVEEMVSPAEAAGRRAIREEERRARRAIEEAHNELIRFFRGQREERAALRMAERVGRKALVKREATERAALIDSLFAALREALEAAEEPRERAALERRLLQSHNDLLDRLGLQRREAVQREGSVASAEAVARFGHVHADRIREGDSGAMAVPPFPLCQCWQCVGSSGSREVPLPLVLMGRLLVLQCEEEAARRRIAADAAKLSAAVSADRAAGLPALIAARDAAEREEFAFDEEDGRDEIASAEALRRARLGHDFFGGLFALLEAEEAAARARIAATWASVLTAEAATSAAIAAIAEAIGAEEVDSRYDLEDAADEALTSILMVFATSFKAIDEVKERLFDAQTAAAIQRVADEEVDGRCDIEDEADDALNALLMRFAVAKSTEERVEPLYDSITAARAKACMEEEEDGRFGIEDDADSALGLILAAMATVKVTEEREESYMYVIGEGEGAEGNGAASSAPLGPMPHDDVFGKEVLLSRVGSGTLGSCGSMAGIKGLGSNGRRLESTLSPHRTGSVSATGSGASAHHSPATAHHSSAPLSPLLQQYGYAHSSSNGGSRHALQSSPNATHRSFVAEVASANASFSAAAFAAEREELNRRRRLLLEEDEAEGRAVVEDDEDDDLGRIVIRVASIATTVEAIVPLLTPSEVAALGAVLDAEDERRADIEDDEHDARRGLLVLRNADWGRLLRESTAAKAAAEVEREKVEKAKALAAAEEQQKQQQQQQKHQQQKLSASVAAAAMVCKEDDGRADIEDAEDDAFSALLIKFAATRVVERSFEVGAHRKGGGGRRNGGAKVSGIGVPPSSSSHRSGSADCDNSSDTCSLLGATHESIVLDQSSFANVSMSYFTNSGSGGGGGGVKSAAAIAAAASATSNGCGAVEPSEGGLVSVPSILIKGGRDRDNRSDGAGGSPSTPVGAAPPSPLPLSPHKRVRISVCDGSGLPPLASIGAVASSLTSQSSVLRGANSGVHHHSLLPPNGNVIGHGGSSSPAASSPLLSSSVSSFVAHTAASARHTVEEDELAARIALEAAEAAALDALLLRCASYVKMDTILFEVIEREALRRFLGRERGARHAIEDAEDAAFRRVQLRFMILRTSVEAAEVPVDLLCDIIGCDRSDLVRANLAKIVPATRDYIDASITVQLPFRRAPESAERLCERLGISFADLVKANPTARLRTPRDFIMGSQRVFVTISTMGTQRLQPPLPPGSPMRRRF